MQYSPRELTFSDREFRFLRGGGKWRYWPKPACCVRLCFDTTLEATPDSEPAVPQKAQPRRPGYITFRIRIEARKWCCPLCDEKFDLRDTVRNTKRRISYHIKKHHHRNGQLVQYYTMENEEEKDLTVAEVDVLCQSAQ